MNMDEVRNPFAPSAGQQPPEFVGREDVLNSANIALQRLILGRPAQPHILLGLRGTGKTVLLNRIETIASELKHITSFIEAPEDRTLPELLYPKLFQALRKLSIIENAKEKAHQALKALRSFVSVFNVSVGGIEISVDPAPGVADSGILELDLTELFIVLGETARSAGLAWTLLIDEVQYLSSEELSALIVALHRASQRNLPIGFFGAGLPQIAKLTGDAKSYSERLFCFEDIGALDQDSSYEAIEKPISSEGEHIEAAALKRIWEDTKGYPYFLQEWGFQAWNRAEQSPITADVIDMASSHALKRLDNGFFRVRYDRLTPKEREYVVAMSRLGKGPYRSSDVADELGENSSTLGPRRAQIIKKGMIYSPSYGDIDFTVPMFDDYLRRNFLT